MIHETSSVTRVKYTDLWGYWQFWVVSRRRLGDGEQGRFCWLEDIGGQVDSGRAGSGPSGCPEGPGLIFGEAAISTGILSGRGRGFGMVVLEFLFEGSDLCELCFDLHIQTVADRPGIAPREGLAGLISQKGQPAGG